MTIIYITESNNKCIAVTFKNNGIVKVQNFRDVSDDNNIYQVNPIETFIGKSQLCNMTDFSGAEDREIFNGNTYLLEIGKENNRYRYVYIGRDKVCSFLTSDKIYKHISNMGNNLSPYSLAIGYENIYYLTPYFRNNKKENIDDIDKIFDDSNISDYQKLKTYKIYSNYD